MNTITLISTIHKEIGKCNSTELIKIIENINPDVIFLEAIEENYTEYDKMLFSQFGIYNDRLELKAIQKYSQNNTFEYVPVLDIELSNEFKIKFSIVSVNKDCQKLLDNYISLAREGGFPFLNSEKSILLQQEMRDLENKILYNEVMQLKVNESIDSYENSMVRNIYMYCKEKSFNTGVFLCGVAHRESIIKKIKEYDKTSELKPSWIFHNDSF